MDLWSQVQSGVLRKRQALFLRRKVSFTNDEIRNLLQLCVEHKDGLNTKFNNTNMNKHKNAVCKKITIACNGRECTVEEVRKKMEKLLS